jgi:hypothetical protein
MPPSSNSNINLLRGSNTKNLHYTMPSVLPFVSNIYHTIPHYLNTASLPFLSNYLSLDGGLDELRFGKRKKRFDPNDHYISATKEYEQHKLNVNLAEKLIHWKSIDMRSRQ